MHTGGEQVKWVYGSPLTMPGGVKQKFASMLTVRVSGKNVMDNKVSKVLPVLKETQFILEKWKVEIAAINGMFQMVTHPHGGLDVGECADWNTVANMLKSLGLLSKIEKGGWHMYDDQYPTLKEAQTRFYSDKGFSLGVKKSLIEAAMENGTIEPSEKTTRICKRRFLLLLYMILIL
jgi:recombination protein RecA